MSLCRHCIKHTLIICLFCLVYTLILLGFGLFLVAKVFHVGILFANLTIQIRDSGQSAHSGQSAFVFCFVTFVCFVLVLLVLSFFIVLFLLAVLSQAFAAQRCDGASTMQSGCKSSQPIGHLVAPTFATVDQESNDTPGCINV